MTSREIVKHGFDPAQVLGFDPARVRHYREGSGWRAASYCSRESDRTRVVASTGRHQGGSIGTEVTFYLEEGASPLRFCTEGSEHPTIVRISSKAPGDAVLREFIAFLQHVVATPLPEGDG